LRSSWPGTDRPRESALSWKRPVRGRYELFTSIYYIEELRLNQSAVVPPDSTDATDMIYVLLLVWQAQFALGYGALAGLRGLYVGSLAALQLSAAGFTLGGLFGRSRWMVRVSRPSRCGRQHAAYQNLSNRGCTEVSLRSRHKRGCDRAAG